MLGASNIGNNWKLAITNFLVVFGVQVAFQVNDLLQTPECWPSPWWIVKTVVSAGVTTLIFYGYNKVTVQKQEVKP